MVVVQLWKSKYRSYISIFITKFFNSAPAFKFNYSTSQMDKICMCIASYISSLNIFYTKNT